MINCYYLKLQQHFEGIFTLSIYYMGKNTPEGFLLKQLKINFFLQKSKSFMSEMVLIVFHILLQI